MIGLEPTFEEHGSSPRVRGTAYALEDGYGSSPRVRGTDFAVQETTPPYRFIPARAGNGLVRSGV